MKVITSFKISLILYPCPKMASVYPVLSYNECMDDHHNQLYRAYLSKDPRFDGVFFLGVKTTGIYCRPICPARAPKESNCQFFNSAEEAQKALFRPCLRCRPELAPGRAPVDEAQRIAHLLANLLQEGELDEKGLEIIADELGISSRQLRRIVSKEFGVSPIELIVTRRLLLAKQLLSETSLSMLDVAFASGFSSIRRFNDAFKKSYGLTPSSLRKNKNVHPNHTESLVLHLHYRPPFDWEMLLSFLGKRALLGVEHVDARSYARTVDLGKHQGWFKITHDEKINAIRAEISLSLTPVLSVLIPKIRQIFDLNARPDLINALLLQDPRLQEQVGQHPGLRVPGCFDGFELAFRAILGQQITVKAATTLATRFVKGFGEIIETPFKELSFLSPKVSKIAGLHIDEVASLGIIRTRASSIIELAKALESKSLKLEAGSDPEKTMKKLVSMSGIGHWTAHYIAMRALRSPDAFPKEDVVLQKKLGGVSPKQAELLSQPWRPWRSYATLHLWNM